MSAAAAVSPTTKVVGLISTAHFFSHFYLLLIPPLFPLLTAQFGVGFTELGVALTAFSVTTALTQAPVGFLVDRVGARRILIAGMLLEAAAFAGIGLSPSYVALVVLLGVAGLANSVYHPADYAILNASVDHRRMGRAFAIHTAAGMFGNAMGPVTMLALMSVLDWTAALVVCGICGGAAALWLAASSAVLQEPVEHRDSPEDGEERKAGLALLLSAPILLGVLFFVGISIAGHGISTFSVSTLTLVHGVSVAAATTVLSAYLFLSPLGVLFGGWVADRIRHHHHFAAGCFVLIAAAVFAVAGLPLPIEGVTCLFGVAGFFSGAVSPSRDMLIRSLTPPREIGKVFGFVSTGFNVGGMVAPLAFGYILDHGEPRGVFWTVGVVSAMTVFTVLTTGTKRRRARGREGRDGRPSRG